MLDKIKARLRFKLVDKVEYDLLRKMQKKHERLVKEHHELEGQYYELKETTDKLQETLKKSIENSDILIKEKKELRNLLIKINQLTLSSEFVPSKKIKIIKEMLKERKD